MIPRNPVPGGALDALIFYVAVLGLLLMAGVFLRLKVKFFKKYFIPASLIAGVLGIIIGPYCLNIVHKEMADLWAALPGRLITVVFAPMLMGIVIPNPKKMMNILGPQLVFNYVGDFIQIGVPFLITALFLVPQWGVNELFGTIVEIGFCGGHGTAGGMIDVFKNPEINWAAGGDLSMMSATVGLVLGIVSGMIIINYGVRKGYTTVIKSVSELKLDETDILPEDKRTPNSYNTINKDIVESFALHAGLIGAAIFIGWFIQKLLGKYVPGLPLFPMAMIGGGIVQYFVSKTSWAVLIDRQTFARIQGLAMEFLIVGAVATIQIPVIIEYAMPLFIMMTVMSVIMVWFFFWAGPRMFDKEWFENAIVNYGTLTAVAAIGLMLLRTVDPEMKTEAGTGYAIKAPFASPFIGGGLVTSSLPLIVMEYGALNSGLAVLALTVVLLVVAKVCGWFHKPVRVYSE